MVAIAVAVLGVTIPLLLSFFFGGQVALYVSPPYGFKDIPDLAGTL